jgi:hypothetical protein
MIRSYVIQTYYSFCPQRVRANSKPVCNFYQKHFFHCGSSPKNLLNPTLKGGNTKQKKSKEARLIFSIFLKDTLKTTRLPPK